MSRTFSLGSRRLLLGALALLLVSLIWTTASASAETIPATCETLQEKLEVAAKKPSHGEGDVVQLSGMCEATNLKSKLGVTIPESANFTLEGAPGPASGFDGNGVTGTMLQSESGGVGVGTMTIANLTFQHAHDTSLVSAALSIRAQSLTLSGDTFVENSDTEGQGGAVDVSMGPTNCPPAQSAALTITHSTFRQNEMTSSLGSEGGALWVGQDCPLAKTVLQDNVFEENTLEVSGSSAYTGGAVSMFTNTGGESVSALQQTGNVFASNRIVATGGQGSYGGGGEWLQAMDLTSIGDRFSGNSISGASGKHWSWGAGLGLINSECNLKTTPTSTLENAVVAANQITGGEPADDGGAGIYVGCSFSESLPNHLALLDSTVTENTAPIGGVGGIDGGPEDHLELKNSIVANDVGGSDVGGFSGTGGLLTAEFSDVCASGSSTTPLPGAGNVCANPLLADNGNPASSDVHEKSASPTIDAGSVGLIPSGLTTDAFGDARTQVRPSCGPSLPAGVDMGADEYMSAAPPCPPPHNPPVPGLTKFIKLKTSKHAVAVTLGCTGASTQICSGMLVINDARSLSKQKVIGVTSSKQESKPIKLGESSFSLAVGHTVTFTVKLNSTGVSLLHRLHSLPTVVLGSEAMPKESVFLFLFHAALFTEPKHKAHKHKHKKRHHHKKRHPKKHH